MTSAQRGQDSPTLYTAAEAAAILRVKKSWLERQAAGRKIPFTMLGRSYRFTSAHLATIVQMHEEAPTPSVPVTDQARRLGRRSTEHRTPEQLPAPLRARPRSGPRTAA
jgi:excisionase family DNA binding protein